LNDPSTGSGREDSLASGTPTFPSIKTFDGPDCRVQLVHLLFGVIAVFAKMLQGGP
jgi:hypothetical protein